MSESGLESPNTSRPLGSRRQWSPFSLSICAQLTICGEGWGQRF